MEGEDDQNINNQPPNPLPPTQQAPHTVSTIKLPILKKGEYDIWAIKMEHYLAHTNYPIWEVIQNRNGPVSITTDTQGQIKVLPPRTAEEILASERERKARTTLLMALPEDHLARFHNIYDAKEMWDAIKTKFSRNAWNTGNKEKDNGRRSGKHEDSKALVTLDREGVDWTSHSEDEQENYAFIACNSSGSDTEVTSCSKECKESYAKLKKLYDEQREQLGDASIEIQAYTQALKKVEAQLVAHQQGQLWYEEKIRFMKIDLDDKTDVLTYHKKLLAEAEKEKEDLKAKVEKWHNSSKNLNILLNSQMSARDKAGLGYGDQMNKGVLSYENEVFQSVFVSRTSETENSPVNDRYAEGMHVVPPPMTGIYIPSGPDKEIDDSQFTYGPKQSKPSESDARSSDFNSYTEDLLLQAGATKASSTNIVNTASTPVSTASPYGGLSFTDLTNTNNDDLEIPALEEIYDNHTTDESWVDAMQEELLQFKIQKVWILVDLPYGKKAIGTKWVYRNKKDERGVVVRNKARLVAQGHRQEEGLSDGCEKCIPSWYSTLSIFLLKNGYRRGTIDKTLFIKKDKHDIILMSSMGELTFFLGLQVKQKEDGIFISQDKYVAEILKKFDFVSVKTASTPFETHKPLVKDGEASDVDVHLYRSMIGSLMYLTASRPDILFAVCTCSRFQVTPKTSQLNSDYAGANLDRKSTTGGCQFLGRRLISWQCKKQIIMATSTTEAEYVAAANCCGQVLWIQNKMLDYGFNFMNTKIYIDNESSSSGCILLGSDQPKAALVFLDKQLKNVPVPLDHFPINALTSKVFSFMVKKGKHFSGKVTPLFPNMLVQPTEDEGEGSERPSEPQPIPSPPHPSADQHETQTNPSPRPSPTSHITDSIPEGSGGNHGGQSSSDRSLLGNEGGMTLQSVSRSLRRNPNLLSHTTESVSKKQRFARKKSLKKQWMQKESVSKQGRKSAKAEPSVHTNKEEVSTDRPNEGTIDQNEGKSATQTAPAKTTPTIFGDDETIAQVLIIMSKNKEKLKEKEKGIDPKDKGKKKIKKMNLTLNQKTSMKLKRSLRCLLMMRRLQEDWEAEAERKRLAEEEATNAALIQDFDDIKARIEADRLLA
ncbi:putative ribonuclease H-like domain-containing protein [Tanacetum coccineum]